MQVVDPKNLGMVYVYQKECGISNSKKIVTASFGPCHVLTGHDPKTKYSFIAHIDDNTDVQGVHNIFSTLRGLGVDLNDLTGVRLLGGYKAHQESNKWAHKIIEVLAKEGMGGKVDFTYFQKKLESSASIPTSDQTHFFGVHLVPETGNFSFFQKVWMKLENEQEKKSESLATALFSEAGIDPSRLSLIAKYELVSRLSMTKEYPLKITVD